MKKRVLGAFHRVTIVLAAILVCWTGATAAQSANELQNGQVTLQSPDGKIEVSIQAKGTLTYAVKVDGRAVLGESKLGLKFHDGLTLGQNVRLVKVERTEVDSTWENRFGKFRQVRDHHTKVRLSLQEMSAASREFELVFRAFDDGVGFRYVLPAAAASAAAGSQEFVLDQELTQFSFPDNYPCYTGTNENTGTEKNPIGYHGSQEADFLPMHLANLPTEQVRMLPLLVKTPVAWVAILEADLYDWAGMWLNRQAPLGDSANGPVTLLARLAPRLDKQGLVKSSFPRQSPWRVLMIARQPGRLVESNLVLNLASPSVLSDTSWVKPGMMAWDWWSNITRPSTATYKELIQFASDMGWPYTLLDGGWSKNDITQPNPAVNMDEVLAFAKEKNVRLWLWMHWKGVDRNDAYIQAFALYEKWGIAGVKIDFMDRDDQEMVNWYEKIVKAAAEHHLMVNYHGAFKPTGMNRTYPNQITREGVLGNEYNRWSTRANPEHKTTLPFTRLVAGPGDYTPGGFLNKQLDQFKLGAKPTQVQGTRCSELALFVCFDSPVCCVADHPKNYKDQLGLDFLKIVPTVWDDTRVVDGAVGEHLVMVRRHGDTWFLGALTDRNARDIPVKLDFLGPGQYTLRLWRDATDSDVEGTHLEVEQRTVTAGDTLTLHLAKAGGAAARFEPMK